MKKVGYFIDPSGRAEVVEIPKDLKGYYKLLDCDTIDITRRKIGGKYYDIICDDEGLFKETVMVSAVDGNNEAMLVGKLLICNHDEKGNEASLTQDDILNIEANVCKRVFVKGDY